MTDLLKIARDRRAELQGEAARIEDFIQMAESLLRDQVLSTALAPDARPAAAVVREVPAAGPPVDSDAGEDEGGADAAVDAAEESEDDADEAAPVAMPAAAAAGSREAGAGLTRINLLRRGPRMVTN